MKRSRSVDLFLVLSAAAAMTGCSAQRERCVDANDNVVEDRNCQGTTTGVYHWYYGGNGGAAVGSHAGGGTVTPGAGDADSATAHGGIGGAGEAHGAGGEGHGGGGGE